MGAMRQGHEGLERLVDRADVDELVLAVDNLCDNDNWDDLLALRNMCRAAHASGRQLWPIASLSEYRLALRAPATIAGPLLEDNTGFPTGGPLTEVIAQHHSWVDLSPYIGRGPSATFVAHERAIRGELIDDESIDTDVLDLPIWLEPWEPIYPVARYSDTSAEFAPPRDVPRLDSGRLGPPGEIIGDPHTTEAFRDLVAPWTNQSNGRVDLVVVEGDHFSAIAALGVTRARIGEISFSEALAWLSWAGASGGAQGRRRGAAYGRFAAWWCVAALGGMSEDWPLPPDDLRDVGGSLRWFCWDAHEPVTGWQLRLAVHDPGEELGMAVVALDHR
jgi:hypothetical protein